MVNKRRGVRRRGFHDGAQMIARLRGTLIDKQPGLAVVDLSGVGYELTIPLSTYYILGEAGSRVDLHVHTHVREDALTLFGFGTRREKQLFVRLIAVNGVGPKMAIAALSGLGTDELVTTIRGRNAARLASVPGLGRRTAERILLEVGGKLDSLAAEPDDAEAAGAAPTAVAVRQDVVSALVNLGYNSRVAIRAADQALTAATDTTLSFDSLLRHSLKALSR